MIRAKSALWPAFTTYDELLLVYHDEVLLIQANLQYALNEEDIVPPQQQVEEVEEQFESPAMENVQNVHPAGNLREGHEEEAQEEDQMNPNLFHQKWMHMQWQMAAAAYQRMTPSQRQWMERAHREQFEAMRRVVMQKQNEHQSTHDNLEGSE